MTGRANLHAKETGRFSLLASGFLHRVEDVECAGWLGLGSLEEATHITRGRMPLPVRSAAVLRAGVAEPGRSTSLVGRRDAALKYGFAWETDDVRTRIRRACRRL